MRAPLEQPGGILKRLRSQSGLQQKEIVTAIEKDVGYSVRSLRRVENGERRPSRQVLTLILIKAFQLADMEEINRILEAFEYSPLTLAESRQFKLDDQLPNVGQIRPMSTSVPEPQKT